MSDHQPERPRPAAVNADGTLRPKAMMAVVAAAMMAGGTLTPDERAQAAGMRRKEKAQFGSKPVTSQQRRNYTARELAEMAANAKQGIPPAGSVADGEIRNAELSGDFERARALREEVKERAPDLARMARAQAKAERRAKRRT